MSDYSAARRERLTRAGFGEFVVMCEAVRADRLAAEGAAALSTDFDAGGGPELSAERVEEIVDEQLGQGGGWGPKKPLAYVDEALKRADAILRQLAGGSSDRQLFQRIRRLAHAVRSDYQAGRNLSPATVDALTYACQAAEAAGRAAPARRDEE